MKKIMFLIMCLLLSFSAVFGALSDTGNDENVATNSQPTLNQNTSSNNCQGYADLESKYSNLSLQYRDLNEKYSTLLSKYSENLNTNTQPTSNNINCILGDANSDGLVTKADSELVLKIATGASPMPSSIKCIDVAPEGKPDGIINVGDALIIERMVQGLINQTPQIDCFKLDQTICFENSNSCKPNYVKKRSWFRTKSVYAGCSSLN